MDRLMKLLPELDPGEKELVVAILSWARPVDEGQPSGPYSIAGRYLAEAGWAGNGVCLAVTGRRWCYTRPFRAGKVFWSCPREQVIGVEHTGRALLGIRFTIRFSDGSAVSVRGNKHYFRRLHDTIRR